MSEAMASRSHGQLQGIFKLNWCKRPDILLKAPIRPENGRELVKREDNHLIRFGAARVPRDHRR